MKIIADQYIPFIKEYFENHGDLILKPGRAISARDVKDADLLLVRSITHVDKHLLEQSNVKFVGSVTAGTDHLDIDWLNKAGILWCAATGFNAPPVADYVVSIIAALKQKKLLTEKVCKVAVIGVGNVGRLVVERLKILNFDITLCDPVRAQAEKDFNSTSIQAISDMDLILLHVPLTRYGEHATYHFIGADFLARQKPGCILLNVSRGAVIDSEALLKHGGHLKWCFDVWEGEPTIKKEILAQALIATPHIAGYSVQSKRRGIDIVYRMACEKKLISPIISSSQKMPQQQLSFAGHNHHWADIILGVFNPLIITAMMRSVLLPAQEYGPLFDEMRNQFNYRHEFAYTEIRDSDIHNQDVTLLKKLGMRMS